MSEADAVRRSREPATVDSIALDLASLGVEPGMTLLVHSSLSALGWVSGGAMAVIEALTRALGPKGTLVMPAFSPDWSEPSYWTDPPVPEAWWQTIRETMPAFDPAATPSRWVGKIPECFRSLERVRRSAHPFASFAARGPRAARVVGRHGLHFCLGEKSPLARLYDIKGHILLLGVGHRRNSSLHLAEYRARYPKKREVDQGAAVRRKGARVWATYRDLDLKNDDFDTIGEAFAGARRGLVASADAQLFAQRELVDFAVRWMEAHR